MMLLKPKVRALMVKTITAGVPPLAAGMSLGMSAKTIGLWVNNGMNYVEYDPVLIGSADDGCEVDKVWVSNADWLKHEKETCLLARAICATEGKLVSILVKRMWKNSGKNPDMMKFLFKNFSHAHGLKDTSSGNGHRKGGEDGTLDGEANTDTVSILLPDNGRMIATAAVVPTRAKP